MGKTVHKLKKALAIGAIGLMTLLPIKNANSQVGTAGFPDSREGLEKIATSLGSYCNPFLQPNNTLKYYGSGDANNDGIRDYNDSNCIEQMIKGNTAKNDQADITGDGAVNSTDLMVFNDFMNGNIPHLPSDWNKLDREEKTSWTMKMFAIDDTDKIPYRNPSWVCNEFAGRTHVNFFGFDESSSKINKDLVYSSFRTNSQSNARFNMPVYYVSIFASPIFSYHSINSVLVGENPLNFEDWMFIEPQTDKEAKIGDWNLPKNCNMDIGGIMGFKNDDISYLDPISFTLTEGVPSVKSYLEQYFVVNKPQPVGVEEVAENANFPEAVDLRQNYPNPFNASTLIEYTIKDPGRVNLEVYNSQGQRIETLVDERQEAGRHSARFNSDKYSSGIYFYTLREENSKNSISKTNKMMIVK